MLNFNKIKVLVVGDIMLDYYLYLKPNQLSVEAPVIVYEHLTSIYELGGAGNVAKNIKTLGGNVTLLGVIGPDTPGQIIKNLARKSQIKYYLFIEGNRNTTIKTRLMVNERQLLRHDKEDKFKVTQLPNFEIDKPDIIIISDYNKGLISNVLVDFVKSFKSKIIVNGKPENIDLYKNMHALILNKEELDKVVKLKKLNTPEELRHLLNLKTLIVTDGKNGSILYSKDKIKIECEKVKIVDITGAGDSFIAAYALASTKYCPKKSAKIATMVGTLKVTKPRTSAVTIKELRRKYDK